MGGFPEACVQLAQSSGPPSLHPDSGYTAHPTVTAFTTGADGNSPLQSQPPHVKGEGVEGGKESESLVCNVHKLGR